MHGASTSVVGHESSAETDCRRSRLGFPGMRARGFHAWRRMRDLGPAWTLRWADELPSDVYGYTDFRTKTITLATGMSFEERRCTITHEVEHARRGPGSSHAVLREEVVVDRRSSRLLLPCVREVADSLIFHHGQYEDAAEDLWVDPWTLEVRLASLRGPEQDYLNERLAEVTLLQGGC